MIKHARADHTHSHGHAKLLQPLLFQLFGLEEKFKAVLALVVSEVESVGPLQKKKKKKRIDISFLRERLQQCHIQTPMV